MATEKLIVELDAKTAKLDAALKKTDAKLDELTKSTKAADDELGGFSQSAKKTASILGAGVGVLAKYSAAALAVGAAISAVVVNSSKARKETELFARQAKTSTENFEALAFAAKQYGIDAQKVGDISKDISDRVGEFASAGTGVFQDYADVMKLTKDEAALVADEFLNMNSEQILGTMAKNMESAGVSGDAMTFVFESIASETSRLLPLFRESSAELNTLKSRYNDVAGSMALTSNQAEALKEASTSFDLLTSSMGKATDAIGATLAPVLDGFFNDIIAVVPDATQSIIDFMNSFLDAENITSIAGVNKEIEASQERILELNHKLEDSRLRGRSYVIADLKDEQARVVALNEQLAVLQEQKAISDADRLTGGSISATGGSGSGGGTGDQIQAIADRFKTEEDLLTEKLERELLIIGENNELKTQLESEYLDNLYALELNYEEKVLAEKAKAEKEAKKLRDIDLKEANSAAKTKQVNSENAISGTIASATAANTLLLDDNKAVGAGIIVAETAQNIVTSVKNSGGIPYGIPAGLAAAAMGATQLAALNSASRGGGSTVAPTATSTTTSSTDFESGTASLELSDATTTGAQALTINVADGDEIGEAIANWIMKAQTEGRV